MNEMLPVGGDSEPAGTATTHHTRSDYRFAPIPEDLLMDTEVGPLAVRVYGVLARHGMTPDSCWPSHARIGRMVGISPRSVQKPLRELEARGWIERFPRFDETGRRSSDGWLVRVTPAFSNAGTASTDAGGTASASAGGTALGSACNESKEEREQEGTKTRVRAPAALPVDDQFSRVLTRGEPVPTDEWEAWYAEVPRKVDRGRARTAYGTARRKVSGARLLAGIRRYAAACEGKDRRYVKHPASWLNAEAWDDEDEVPARGSSRHAAAEGWDRTDTTTFSDVVDL